MAHASLHKLVELYEEHQADPNHPAPRTVVVIRDPAQVPPSSLRAAVTTPREAFPPELYPTIAAVRAHVYRIDRHMGSRKSP